MKTILLVDDDPDVLEVIGETLSTFGYKVIPSPDAETALFIIKNRADIDLVITDLRMPGMDGIELYAKLRKELPSVPVIILTAYGSVETYLQSLSQGVFEYLNKPFQLEELNHVVKSVLQRAAAVNVLHIS